MAAIIVNRTDTFEQWRVKTNEISVSIFDLESNLDDILSEDLGYTKNASAAITGGTINGASIGASTRSSGAFTTLSANGAVSFDGVSIADGAPANSFVILSNGNIGLGKANPTVKLDIDGFVKAGGFEGSISGVTGAFNTVNCLNTNITTMTSVTANDAIGNLRTIPQKTFSDLGSYSLLASDAGKHINLTGSGGATVPANVFTIGQVVTIFNNTAGNRQIIQDSGVTMYQAGTGSTGTRTLSSRGLASVLCVASNTFVITGVGLT